MKALMLTTSIALTGAVADLLVKLLLGSFCILLVIPFLLFFLVIILILCWSDPFQSF